MATVEQITAVSEAAARYADTMQRLVETRARLGALSAECDSGLATLNDALTSAEMTVLVQPTEIADVQTVWATDQVATALSTDQVAVI